MEIPKEKMTFCWWNVDEFAHFDPNRIGDRRWPDGVEEYQSKRKRIAKVLAETMDESLDILALGEVTEQAARDLRDVVYPDHKVISLDLAPQTQAEFQIAFVYRPNLAGKPDLWLPDAMPRKTRPMASLDIAWPGHRIRFFACHWTARFEESSKEQRHTLAKYLSAKIFDFLQADDREEQRHIIIVGDLNEPPYGDLFRDTLHTFRDRASARRKPHPTDKDVKRTRLYNTSWRLLGERLPHQPSKVFAPDTAGTHFWQRQKEWHTLDHIIVDGSLLGNSPPFLEESEVEVVVHPLLMDGNGLPNSFDWNSGRPVGLSDHLPIRGTIKLTEDVCHD